MYRIPESEGMFVLDFSKGKLMSFKCVSQFQAYAELFV
jgi:hypothetical protein